MGDMPEFIYVMPDSDEPAKLVALRNLTIGSRYAYCPPGYRVVKEEPEEPEEAMIKAGSWAVTDQEIFRAMLDASPKPPGSHEGDEDGRD